jgi:hypothetical protein
MRLIPPEKSRDKSGNQGTPILRKNLEINPEVGPRFRTAEKSIDKSPQAGKY